MKLKSIVVIVCAMLLFSLFYVIFVDNQIVLR